MLTKKQNLLETIHGGNPDRFVNQYEAFAMVFHPIMTQSAMPQYGEENVVNAWGVTNSWPIGTPGSFPVHTPEKIVVKDITHWRDYVKAPATSLPDAAWEPFIAQAEAIDRNEYFVTPFVAPGIFEQCHHLCEIQNTLINFYEEPDDLKDLIKFLTEWEVKQAEEICKHLKPDGLFHHDDWGSQTSTFISPDMFEEFLLPAYKDIYGCYKENGVELIVHHSDSYAATLVPYMIDMGIDIWQGVMTTNNIPELIKKYGGKISFMGGIDSAKIDYEGWTPEVVAKEVKRACDECGKLYFIPSASQGLAMSTFEGVYEATTEAIDNYSKVVFGK
ncbi:MAG: uroporphyrinogen decarboxylase family protein [Lachnospiraceae bacterium]|nr:uroporphyrinogen decarboxylase family protein [Lachnospiraceae bacterium]MDY4970351.1 uroporphyrinogen decarboxylase family protein [Lachnospiraceae bacterium]